MNGNTFLRSFRGAMLAALVALTGESSRSHTAITQQHTASDPINTKKILNTGFIATLSPLDTCMYRRGLGTTGDY